MKEIIKTKGMMCSKCEERVSKGLLQLDHINNVVADHKTGDVTIEHDDQFKIEDAKTLIYDIGYDVL